MEITEINAWSSEAKEKFIELIADQEILIFKPKITQNGRTFGELLIDSIEFIELYCAAKTLCANSLAISTQNYMNYINGEFNLNLINCYIGFFLVLTVQINYIIHCRMKINTRQIMGL